MDVLQCIFEEADTLELYFSDAAGGGTTPQQVTTDLVVGKNPIPHTLGRQAYLVQAFNSSHIPLGVDWTAYDDTLLEYSSTYIFIYANEEATGVILNIF